MGCNLSAEVPSFWLVRNHAAANHTVSGVRVRRKIVPAVTEVLVSHVGHHQLRSARR